MGRKVFRLHRWTSPAAANSRNRKRVRDSMKSFCSWEAGYFCLKFSCYSLAVDFEDDDSAMVAQALLLSQQQFMEELKKKKKKSG